MARKPKEPSQTDSQKKAAHWKRQLELTKDDITYKQYIRRGAEIVRRFRDERGDRNAKDNNTVRRMSCLWANVKTIGPAIYGKRPVPLCERRFKDKDEIARIAASMLERAMRNEIETNGFHAGMRRAVLDYQLPGRGVLWCRYEPTFGESVSLPSIAAEQDEDDYDGEAEPETPEEEKLEDTGDEIVRESVPVDYVNWNDFFLFPVIARTWDEVQAVGKRVYMDRKALIERFGEKKGKLIPLTHSPMQTNDNYKQTTKQTSEYDMAEVFEIWCKYDKTALWIAEGYDDLCDEVPDPLNLENFFPTPMPLQSTTTNDTQFPVPDYVEYQDQAVEVDELTQRIHMLTKACKVAGAYDASQKGLQRLLDESLENKLVPVDSWAAFAEKGGLQGVIVFLPLKEIMETINQLVQVRKLAMEDMDRITGVMDVMRGTTDARESMGAQKLKSNYGNVRLSDQQNEVARYARDVLCIMGEIIAEHFQPETIIQISGAMYEEGVGPDTIAPQQAMPPPPPQPQGGVAPLSAAAGLPGGEPPSPFTPGVAPPGLPPQIGQPPNPIMVGAPMPIDPRKAQMDKILKAIGLLKDQKLRGFRIDIETDSTIAIDSETDKQARVEFIKGVTDFLKASAEIGAQLPDSIPMLGKMLQFGVRGFRVGRDLEHTIEEFCDRAEETAKKRASQPPPPSPEQIKADSDRETALIAAKSSQADNEAELRRQALENQGEAENSQSRMREKQMDLMLERMEMLTELVRKQGEHNSTLVEGALAERGHQQKLEQMDAAHEHKMKQAKNPQNGGK